MGRGFGREQERQRPLLSVCMIARDEERWIARALESVRQVAEDLVVVDTGSRDSTPEIARSLGARVFLEAWEEDFAKARNQALQRARGRWILVLDADEYLHPEDVSKVYRLVSRAPRQVAGYSVVQVNLASNDPQDILDQSSTIRIFRNDPAHRYRYRVHEQIVQSLRGRVEQTDIRLLHTGYLPDVLELKGKSQRNISLLLRTLEELPQGDLHRCYVESQLGAEYIRLQEWSQARQHYERAFQGWERIVRNPLNGDYSSVLLVGYVHCLLNLGDHRTAWEVVEKAVRLGFSLPILWFVRGWVELVQGRWAEGIRDLLWFHALLDAGKAKGGYASRPLAEHVWLLASQAMWHQGNHAMAAAMVVKGLEQWPRSRSLAGRAAEVAALAPGLIDFLAQRLPLGSLEAVVDAALEKGFGPAAEGLARALALRDEGLTWVLLAKVALHRGDQGLARTCLLKVEGQSPHHVKAQGLLREIERQSA